MATGSFDAQVIKAHRGKSVQELATADVDALHGVSAGDKDHLSSAFGIETIHDLGTNAYFRTAQAISEAEAGIDHDRGPDVDWSALFETAPHAKYQAHPTSFRLDFGPTYYRGRLDGTARVMVVGQDPAANELVGHRSFVGTSGQRLQAFLRRLGIARDYVMLNTFLYPVYGQFTGDLKTLTKDAEILGFRNACFDRVADTGPLEVVLAAGAAAHDAVARWPRSAEFQVVEITHPSAHDHAALLANWNAGLATLRATLEPEVGVAVDPSNYGTDFAPEDQEPIPRYDLPFGVPTWHGVGTHARRGRNADNSTNPKEIIWTAP